MIGLASVLFLDLASALVVAWWVVVLLVVTWALLFLVALAWWSPHPRRLPWVAVASFGLWVVVVIGGTIAFGG